MLRLCDDNKFSNSQYERLRPVGQVRLGRTTAKALVDCIIVAHRRRVYHDNKDRFDSFKILTGAMRRTVDQGPLRRDAITSFMVQRT